MNTELIHSFAHNTQNGCVYVYLHGNEYKRRVLYSSGGQYFYKDNGVKFFKHPNDIEKIKNYLK